MTLDLDNAEHLTWKGTITATEGDMIGAEMPTPLGKKHLHLVCPSGAWIWIVREGGHSAICKTDRCRPVVVKEQAS